MNLNFYTFRKYFSVILICIIFLFEMASAQTGTGRARFSWEFDYPEVNVTRFELWINKGGDTPYWIIPILGGEKREVIVPGFEEDVEYFAFIKAANDTETSDPSITISFIYDTTPFITPGIPTGLKITIMPSE